MIRKNAWARAMMVGSAFTLVSLSLPVAVVNAQDAPSVALEQARRGEDGVSGAGATYVARFSVYHVRPLIRALKNAMLHKGFGFVEVLSSCPTQYGRRNAFATPVEMLHHFKETCVTVKRAERMSVEELQGKTIIGELVKG